MTLLLIITNKVFSPQYIVWFAPLLAVALRQPQMSEHQLKHPRTHRAISILMVSLAVLTLVTAALGSYVYPSNYNFIWVQVGVEFAPVAELALRNLLIVIMAALSLCWLALAAWCDARAQSNDSDAHHDLAGSS